MRARGGHTWHRGTGSVWVANQKIIINGPAAGEGRTYPTTSVSGRLVVCQGGHQTQSPVWNTASAMGAWRRHLGHLKPHGRVVLGKC